MVQLFGMKPHPPLFTNPQSCPALPTLSKRVLQSLKFTWSRLPHLLAVSGLLVHFQVQINHGRERPGKSYIGSQLHFSCWPPMMDLGSNNYEETAIKTSSPLLIKRALCTEGLLQRTARGDYKLHRRRGRRRHRSGADVIKWSGLAQICTPMYSMSSSGVVLAQICTSVVLAKICTTRCRHYLQVAGPF